MNIGMKIALVGTILSLFCLLINRSAAKALGKTENAVHFEGLRVWHNGSAYGLAMSVFFIVVGLIVVVVMA